MQHLLDRFETGFNRLVLFLACLVAGSIGLIAVLIPVNLFLVKTQIGSLWWLYEGVEYALYTGVFIGAPWVLQQGAHIKIDVLIGALPAQFTSSLEKLLDGAGMSLCLVLCFYGVRAALSEFEDGTLPDKDLRIENWIVLVIFALSFLLLAVEFALRLLRAQRSAPDAGDAAKTARSGF